MVSPYAEAYLLSLISCIPCENYVYIFTDEKNPNPAWKNFKATRSSALYFYSMKIHTVIISLIDGYHKDMVLMGLITSVFAWKLSLIHWRWCIVVTEWVWIFTWRHWSVSYRCILHTISSFIQWRGSSGLLSGCIWYPLNELKATMALRSGLNFCCFTDGKKTKVPSSVHIPVGMAENFQNTFSLKNRFFLKILITFLFTTGKNILSIEFSTRKKWVKLFISTEVKVLCLCTTTIYV